MVKYVLKPRLKDSGYPTHNPFYKYAHNKTDKLEKEKFPTGYEKMKKVDEKLAKHELAGKNLRNGKVEVSRKVPKKFRSEVAFHEKTESSFLRKRIRKNHGK